MASSSNSYIDIDSALNISTNINSQNTDIQNIETSKYNYPSYKLQSDDESSIYIFKNGLFTRLLLNIDPSKPREMLIQCTTCSFNKVVKITGFQSSNFVRHYKLKHLNIAYNKENEKNRKLKTEIPTKKDFFNQLETRKRV